MAAGGRHGARRLLVQALYQHQISGHTVDELREQFAARSEFESIDAEYFGDLLQCVLSDVAELDEIIAASADRPVEQLDPVEKSVLWLGLAELRFRSEIPTRVVLNEAVELAKQFGAADGHRYVNAVLDSAAATLRDGAHE